MKARRILSIIKIIGARTVVFLELCSKVLGGLLALFVLQSYLFPRFIWRHVEAWTAERNGLVGYVYYEVKENRGLTAAGQLFLLSDSKQGLYRDIHKGDRLIANSEVNFHMGPFSTDASMYLLKGGECVIVLEEPKNKISVEKALSGGYLKVATTACGLFK
jgi:hypothetical protein